MKKITRAIIFLILITAPCINTYAEKTDTIRQDAGWSFPYLGQEKGTWDASVGVFFWMIPFNARNLQLKGDIDLAPGMRWHTVVRANQEQDMLQQYDRQGSQLGQTLTYQFYTIQ